MRKTIYLANPYGFSAQQRALLLPQIVTALEALGLEVWEPFERNNQVDMSRAGWAYRIGQADFRDVREADADLRGGERGAAGRGGHGGAGDGGRSGEAHIPVP